MDSVGYLTILLFLCFTLSYNNHILLPSALLGSSLVFYFVSRELDLRCEWLVWEAEKAKQRIHITNDSSQQFKKSDCPLSISSWGFRTGARNGVFIGLSVVPSLCAVTALIPWSSCSHSAHSIRHWWTSLSWMSLLLSLRIALSPSIIGGFCIPRIGTLPSLYHNPKPIIEWQPFSSPISASMTSLSLGIATRLYMQSIYISHLSFLLHLSPFMFLMFSELSLLLLFTIARASFSVGEIVIVSSLLGIAATAVVENCFSFLSNVDTIAIISFFNSIGMINGTVVIHSRFLILAYWAVSILIITLLAILCLQFNVFSQIIVRKIFHFLSVILFIPVILIDIQFMAICFSIAAIGFITLEFIRFYVVSGGSMPLSLFFIDVIGRWNQRLFLFFLDSRDKGPLVLTHIYLLLACAWPVWVLSSCNCSWTNPSLPSSIKYLLFLACASGIISVGIGDSMATIGGLTLSNMKSPSWIASMLGCTIGDNDYDWRKQLISCLSSGVSAIIFRIRRPSGRKTVAGIASSFIAMSCFSMGIGYYMRSSMEAYVVAVFACFVTAIMEGITDQIDNLLLPIVFYISIVCGMALSAS